MNKNILIKEWIDHSRKDLDELIRMCNNDEITSLRDETIPLNDYSVLVRYPSHEELNQNDKNQAINIAKTVLKLISDHLA